MSTMKLPANYASISEEEWSIWTVVPATLTTAS